MFEDFSQEPFDHETNIEDELLVQSYLDGEMGPVEKRAFEMRLADDPVLSRLVADWQGLWERLDNAEPPLMSRSAASGVVAELERAAAPMPVLGRMLLVQLFVALGTILLAWPLWRVSVALFGSLLDTSVWLELAQSRWSSWELAGRSLRELSMGIGEQFAGWQAAWTGLLTAVPLSLQLLLPLAAGALVIWLVSGRLLLAHPPQLVNGRHT